MSGTIPREVPDDLGGGQPDTAELRTLLLHAESIAVSKRVRRAVVKATRSSVTRQEVVSTNLNHEQVVVERIAIGRVVDSVPPVRHDGDVTIMPVVEEEVVLVRRLVLKEEVHFRRVRSVTAYSETVAVRQQHVTVTRTVLDD